MLRKGSGNGFQPQATGAFTKGWYSKASFLPLGLKIEVLGFGFALEEGV